jgi:hypothetical protein
MSREFHLITRERPSGDGFLAALCKVSSGDVEPKLDGDFEDPNAYVNVSGPDVWIELEPPGHVEAADLEDSYEGRVLPEPDSDLCLWLTVANIPAGAPAGSADTAWRVFEDLATEYSGMAVAAPE